MIKAWEGDGYRLPDFVAGRFSERLWSPIFLNSFIQQFQEQICVLP
ncbi:hypothetical protein ThidrDRAFT_2223 [Thiorhodococcus drewsii AZ1]|uniref:Uncharacterized protein n=1 Tax=Thiorhodococcus drewsii AZ1 TaxID=765913 RepID=G2E1R0_9GAMM|nr:hypothetical protein ThidrDRAFT_2223 [Thiorhodococcus drewsii AZ1]